MTKLKRNSIIILTKILPKKINFKTKYLNKNEEDPRHPYFPFIYQIDYDYKCVLNNIKNSRMHKIMIKFIDKIDLIEEIDLLMKEKYYMECKNKKCRLDEKGVCDNYGSCMFRLSNNAVHEEIYSYFRFPPPLEDENTKIAAIFYIFAHSIKIEKNSKINYDEEEFTEFTY